MLTGQQLRAARAMLRLEQAELARTAGVSPETIKRLERHDGLLPAQAKTLMSIRHALEAAGLMFIDENGGGAGIRLKKPIGAN